jgi:hypothetical protein
MDTETQKLYDLFHDTDNTKYIPLNEALDILHIQYDKNDYIYKFNKEVMSNELLNFIKSSPDVKPNKIDYIYKYDTPGYIGKRMPCFTPRGFRKLGLVLPSPMQKLIVELALGYSDGFIKLDQMRMKKKK